MVGCIDDTHIPIIAPPENETDYCMEWKDARWKGSMRFLHQGGAAMAAVEWNASILLLFLFVCSVLVILLLSDLPEMNYWT